MVIIYKNSRLIIKEGYKSLKENTTEVNIEKNNLSLIGKELRILAK